MEYAVVVQRSKTRAKEKPFKVAGRVAQVGRFEKERAVDCMVEGSDSERRWKCVNTGEENERQEKRRSTHRRWYRILGMFGCKVVRLSQQNPGTVLDTHNVMRWC